jgi:hypothetical protein
VFKTIWNALKRFWAGWTKVAHIIGNFQARVLLTIMYAILVLPFGLAVRLFGDPLRMKTPPDQWLDHAEEKMDLEWAHRQ